MKLKISIITIFSVLFISCASVEKVGTTAVDTFIACEKADIGQTIQEVGLTILAVATQILMAGNDYIAKLDEIGTKYGNDTEACAVKAIDTVLTSGTGSASHSLSPEAAARAESMIRAKGWKFKASK